MNDFCPPAAPAIDRQAEKGSPKARGKKRVDCLQLHTRLRLVPGARSRSRHKQYHDNEEWEAEMGLQLKIKSRTFMSVDLVGEDIEVVR